MNREETIKVIQDYTEYFNRAKDQGRTVSVFDYLDRLEMNKEKAITWLTEMTNGCKEDSSPNKEISKAIQFAIDYMKDEGEIIGWVNYYSAGEIGGAYATLESAKRHGPKNCIQIPIRKPK